MQPSNCPLDAELQAFAHGDMVGARFDVIANHVGDCSICEARLSAFDDDQEAFEASLRVLEHQAGADQSEVPANLMNAARTALLNGSGSGPELVIDSGCKIAAALGEGGYRLGKFQLLGELGVGSFGYVFLARDTELGRTVAVKIQRAGGFADAAETDRFLREARSTAQLTHPGVVAIYETGKTEDGACYLVTEYVRGETLEHRLQSGPLEFLAAARMAAEVGDILQYAHANGVVHRDVKPSNIMLDSEGRPHIMDFGLAKRDTGDSTVTQTGQIMGTPAYMSPEQARGESHYVDARSDIYSLGVILYELLTGERPFQGNRRMLLLQVLEDEPRPPRRLDDKIPRDLETICQKAMAKSPHRRYASAGEFADDLRRFLRGEPVKARPVSRTERLWRWCVRNPLAAGLFIAVTLSSVVGLVQLSTLPVFFVKQTALDSARMEAEMLEEINTYYSEIVDRLDGRKVPITHEYLAHPGAIPLPATFTIEASRRISRTGSGMLARVYSDYPFPWRTDGGPRDDFERHALVALRDHPADPYYEFTEVDGQPVLHYATARVMKESCVKCHNGMSESPKRDWKVGEVGGIQKLTRPLERDVARTHNALRDTFFVLGGISVLLLGASFIVLVAGRRTRL